MQIWSTIRHRNIVCDAQAKVVVEGREMGGKGNAGREGRGAQREKGGRWRLCSLLGTVESVRCGKDRWREETGCEGKSRGRERKKKMTHSLKHLPR